MMEGTVIEFIITVGFAEEEFQFVECDECEDSEMSGESVSTYLAELL
jgi:hypothetical protein